MKQDWIARQLRAEVLVGTFLLLIFLGVGYFTIILSRDAWFAPKHPYTIAFETVMGLRADDSVVVRGLPMGQVREIKLAGSEVHVLVSLNQELELREGYRVRIVPTSVLGGHYLEISEGPETNAPLGEVSLLRGNETSELISDAAELVAALKHSFVEGGMAENLRITSEKIRIISERLEAGEGTLGRLVAKNDTLYQDLADTAAALKQITGSMAAGEGTLGRLLAKDDRLYDDLAATASSLRSVAEKLDKGEGVLGKLLSDEKMGREVGEIVTEARAAIDDMRESTPVVTFTSVFFGAF